LGITPHIGVPKYEIVNDESKIVIEKGE